MSEVDHPILGHLYERDKEKAEGHITADRVKILGDNGLIVVSEYTLQILHSHYRRAENMARILDKTHRNMDLGKVPRQETGGGLFALEDRVNWLVNEWNTLKYSDGAKGLDLENIGYQLTNAGITTKAVDGCEMELLHRVSLACKLIMDTRGLFSMLSGALAKIAIITSNRVAEMTTALVNLNATAEATMALKTSLDKATVQPIPEEECHTLEQSEVEISGP